MGLYVIRQFLIAGSLTGLLLQIDDATAAPDMLLLDGVVHTMNAKRDIVEAVAIEKGKIVAVGSSKQLLALVDENTRLVNLRGMPLFPGFTDAHVHPLSGGATLIDLSFSDEDDATAIQAKLKSYVATNPDRPVVVGRGWSLTQFENGNPNKHILDEIVSDRPVILTDSNHHSVWVNSQALERAGINRDTADPQHGLIERDAEGEPSGTLRESARDLVSFLIPVQSTADKVSRIALGTSHLHSFGYTAYLAAAVASADDDAWVALGSELKAHVHLALLPRTIPLQAEKQFSLLQPTIAELEKRRAKLDERGLAANYTKIFLDGGLESCTAAFNTVYADAGCGKGHSGELIFPPEFFSQFVQQLDKQGFSAHVHSIGDRTTRVALDAISETGNSRHGISHLQFVHPDDHSRFPAKSVAAVIQALWAYPYDQSMLPFNNSEIGPWRYPFGSLAEAGALLVAGSDWPVSTANPFHALEVAVLRKDPEVDGGDAWLPDQVLTVDQYMAALTINGAIYLGDADVRGSIETGKQADLVWLSADPYQVEPERLSDITVQVTMFNGEIVYLPRQALIETSETTEVWEPEPAVVKSLPGNL